MANFYYFYTFYRGWSEVGWFKYLLHYDVTWYVPMVYSTNCWSEQSCE